MAKKLAIPEDRREWPDWEYRPFPKYVGKDENGQDLIANTQEEYDLLLLQKVWPKELGYDVHGKVVICNGPDEMVMHKSRVARPMEKVETETETEPETSKPARKK